MQFACCRNEKEHFGAKIGNWSENSRANWSTLFLYPTLKTTSAIANLMLNWRMNYIGLHAIRTALMLVIFHSCNILFFIVDIGSRPLEWLFMCSLLSFYCLFLCAMWQHFLPVITFQFMAKWQLSCMYNKPVAFGFGASERSHVLGK